MPLIRGSSKKALKKNIETEMEAHPDKKEQDLAIAYAVQRRNAHKMAKGGMVDIDDMEDSREMDMLDQSEEGEMDGVPKSIVDAIRMKKRMAKGGMVESHDVDLQENSNEDLNLEDQLSYEAARKDTYYDIDDQADEQPMDSNEHGDDLPDEDAHSMISAIRRKMRK